MRTPAIVVIIVLAVLLMVSCGSGNSGRVNTKEKKPVSLVSDNKATVQTREEVSSADDTQKKRFVIEKVKIFPPDPTTVSNISAEARISGDESRAFEYSYIFWVNAEKIKEGTDNKLSSRFYKKNDFVFVDVLASKDGKLIQRKRSDMVQILNSSPEIKGVDFPDIRGPGTYEITVNAVDIDNDPLMYEIEGNDLPEDISINSKTGTVTYTLKDRPPEKLVFFVVVKDDNEGEAKQEVILTFREFEEGDY